MKNKIILNWMPPAMIELPSPAMSILKRYLENHGFDVEIIYWNLLLHDLQKDFIWNPHHTLNDKESLYLFYNYIAIKRKDKSVQNHIKIILQSIKPQYRNISPDFYDNHMQEYADKFETEVKRKLTSYDFTPVLLWGMSVNLYQWICSSIIGEMLKEIAPQVPITVGGIGTKEAAQAYMESFPKFNFALWGEGENPLYLLACTLQNKLENYNTLPNLFYREEGRIRQSPVSNRLFIDLSDSSVRPDFTEYFTQLHQMPWKDEIQPALPIESSRGCHWNRCHFCYLNMGYKYRTKPTQTVITELEEDMKLHNVHKFQFVDNDVIGKDLDSYENLLDKLIELKDEYPEFTIILAEIVTKGIHERIIKKMSLAGYIHVQIGYESLSDNLLKRIEKKNSFASNLLFIKFADLFNIHVGGANIIRNLLEETDNDISECIENLHFLRFFLAYNKLNHTHTQLGITHNSRYYKTIKQIETTFAQWKEGNYILKLIPDQYLKNNDEYFFILERLKGSSNPLWEYFQKIEQNYLNNIYEYGLIKKDKNTIVYIEYYNKVEINRLEFENSSYDWQILSACNKEVQTLQGLYSACSQGITTIQIVDILKALKGENLIYYNNDYSEIISILNTNIIK